MWEQQSQVPVDQMPVDQVPVDQVPVELGPSMPDSQWQHVEVISDQD